MAARSSYGGASRHSDTQFSQPQHEPVAQGWQIWLGGHSVPSLHTAWQVAAPKSHACPSGHGSVSSQRPAAGMHAPMQSRQSGQLEVAQPSQNEPAPQSAHIWPLHGAAHWPVENTQTPPGQSACVVHAPLVEVVEVVDVVEVLVVDVVEPPEPPEPPGSTTTEPPHATAPSVISRAKERMGRA